MWPVKFSVLFGVWETPGAAPLGIVLFSYAGKLCWGFTADWDLMPDLHEVVKATEAALQELRKTKGRDGPGGDRPTPEPGVGCQQTETGPSDKPRLELRDWSRSCRVEAEDLRTV